MCPGPFMDVEPIWGLFQYNFQKNKAKHLMFCTLWVLEHGLKSSGSQLTDTRRRPRGAGACSRLERVGSVPVPGFRLRTPPPPPPPRAVAQPAPGCRVGGRAGEGAGGGADLRTRPSFSVCLVAASPAVVGLSHGRGPDTQHL